MKVGIDVGSYYLKAVIIDDDQSIKHTFFRHHQGKPYVVIKDFKELFKLDYSYLGITGVLSKLFTVDEALLFDEVKSVLKGCAQFENVFHNILHLGASTIALIKLNEKGELLDFQTNSICAAGTGSFLDQQAERMNIKIEDFSGTMSHSEPPSIAARCSVFAKSDLIHRQQEGYSIPELWCGLCKGLSSTISSTLLRGNRLKGKILISGGVALNNEVVRWIKDKIEGNVKVVENPHLVQAIGAAMDASKKVQIKEFLEGFTGQSVYVKKDKEELRPSLALEKSKLFEKEIYREYVDGFDNEVRIIEPLSGEYDISLGIDIGSTSTKIVLLDKNQKVIVDIYRRTLSDPVGAVKKLFKSIRDIEKSEGVKFNVIACGTTGSGRKLIGQIVGADKIVNEITAHARGAKLLFGNDIETIFEIGGQDSKYIHLKNGRVDNVNMNYVCAAGTGSFVEEQADKLGIKVNEIGDVVMGVSPPFTSDRCTVFMEQDVEKLLREGYSREESIAAVLYSVCFNYLTKVVGKRPVTGKRILFQGATARNKGLVAAFERILDREIVTSHFCHVTGSIGAAKIAMEKVEREGKVTSFKGIDIYRKEVSIRYSKCDLCSNYCKITFVKIEGEDGEPSWGYMCGRDPDDTVKKENVFFKAFEKRESMYMKTGLKKIKNKKDIRIVMPRALAAYSHLPLWRAFFSELGIPLSLTRPTNREIVEEGINNSTSDYCFPVKAFMGHTAEALSMIKEKGYVFIPHLIVAKKSKFTSKSVFCPYVQASPSIAKSSERFTRKLEGRLLSPVIDFSKPHRYIVNELFKVFGELGFNRQEISNAWRKAVKSYKEYQNKCVEEGKRILEEIRRTGEKAIVVVGRFYNIYDGGVNLEIPRKFSELGIRIIPYEFLPFEEESVGEFFQNMFWYYGQRIISASKFVKKSDNLFLLYLTNFSCGPDSFILSYVEEIMGTKPYLILELDEHSADAGYGTRIEAFYDVIKDYVLEKEKEKTYLYIKSKSREIGDRLILIPPMHPSCAPMFASAFRKHGYNATVLPDVTPDQFELGRKYTRGTECLPTQVTLGNILNFLNKRQEDPGRFVLFMPTSDGPCRFGQYVTLQRIIFNKLGYEDMEIISPSAVNAYMGLENDLRKDLWRAILTGDIIFKMFCRIAPYEMERGEAKKTFNRVLNDALKKFENGENFIKIIENAQREFLKVPVLDVEKPLIGIVGEIFVRANPFSCDYVVDRVIDGGGEPWLAPISEWILYTSHIHRLEAKKKMSLSEIFKSFLKNNFLVQLEHRAYEAAGKLLKDRKEPPIEQIVGAGEKYFPVEFTGEAIITVGRALLFIRRDNARMIINASPFTCMPGNTTSAIFQTVSREEGVPIINMFYDGTGKGSEKIASFLKNISEREGLSREKIAEAG